MKFDTHGAWCVFDGRAISAKIVADWCGCTYDFDPGAETGPSKCVLMEPGFNKVVATLLPGEALMRRITDDGWVYTKVPTPAIWAEANRKVDLDDRLAPVRKAGLGTTRYPVDKTLALMERDTIAQEQQAKALTTLAALAERAARISDLEAGRVQD